MTYLEGYLWDPPRAKEAFLKAARIAHEAGRRVSLTLSDPFCVERHREEFLGLVQGHVDVLFANEVEICSLYQTQTFDEALQQVRGHCEIAGAHAQRARRRDRRGRRGHVIDGGSRSPASWTTGAGDLYAAGFLYGLTRGLDIAACGRIGGIAAAEVISHFGARPGRIAR